MNVVRQYSVALEALVVCSLSLLKILSNSELLHALEHLKELTLLTKVGRHGTIMLCSPFRTSFDQYDCVGYMNVVDLLKSVKI